VATPATQRSRHVPVHFPLKLVSRRMLAPTVGHYTFVRDDGQPLDFIPGQFIQVHFRYRRRHADQSAVSPTAL